MGITVKEVHKYYGIEHILKGITFELYKGEKVGLLGKNGAGKTTLFKILSGAEVFDGGSVNMSGKACVLDQIPEYPLNYTVLDVLKTSFKHLFEIKGQMKVLEKSMVISSKPAIIKEYSSLQTEFETLGGYSINSKVAKICNGLSIDEDMQKRLFIHLSGGEKTRINLGRIILQNPDILLLDEPTNHLDINMTEWLEDYLTKYKGTVLAISHDRYFLNKTVKRIIEIVDGKAEFYGGSYSFYVKEKELRYLKKIKQYEQEQKKIKQLEETVNKMRQWAQVANNPAMHRRAIAIEKRIGRIEKTNKPINEKDIKSIFKETKFSSNDVVLIKDLQKSFNLNRVIDNINISVQKGDRIGLIGNNGCGKTTLLRLITGEEIPDCGVCKIGTSIKYAVLPQIIVFEEPDLNILDTLRNTFLISEEAARNRLATFHFKGEEVFKKVGELSGGEKSRLKLCILMNDDINLLLLDEPTNHLDIASREWIEEAIDKYNQTLLFVSHDRYLIKRFATRIWDLEDGKVFDFKGSYEDYRKWKAGNISKIANNITKNKVLDNKKKKNNISKIKNERTRENKRLSSKSIRQVAGRLREVEKNILLCEEKLKNIESNMVQQASNYEKLQILIAEKKELDLKLDKFYMEWEELHDIQR